jgi:tetratricopeptide (TPR) repeat protein
MAAPLSIKLRCASWQQLSAIYKRDLSRSAMFLRSANPPPLGTAVRIDLTLPSDSMIVLTGTVSEHVPPGGLEGRGPGVDIQLAAIPQSALWLIETALASAQKGGRAGTSSESVAAEAPSAHDTPGAPAREAGDGGLENDSDWAQAEDELVAALAAEHESLRKLNPFQVLGVGYEAGDVEVRSAFAELTKRYHPDRFARYASQELRHHAAEIFILIRDAYRRLGDEKGRQSTLAQIGPRAPRPPANVRAGTPPPVASTSVVAPVPAPTSSRPGPPAPPGAASARPGAPPAPSRAATPPPVPGPPPRASTVPEPAPPNVTGRVPARPGTPPPVASQAIPRAPETTRLPTVPGEEGRTDLTAAESLLDQGKYDEALAVYKIYARKNPADRAVKAGIELAEGMRALAQRDRLEAAQRFELVLELDPSNERAARELAEMRRQATNERKGLLTRLLGKKE